MAKTESTAKKIAQDLLNRAGIKIGGSNPWDIQVHDDRFYRRVLSQGNLGLGESYMEGWWDCEKIDEFIAHILDADLDKKVEFKFNLLWYYLSHKLFNFQTKPRAKEVAIKHYNIGNKLYQRMLDKTMNYSCGYWRNTKSLDTAQKNKMDLICQKLHLEPGMRLLDIGCGWGSFAKYAAENYGVSVVGVTISEAQKELADKHCKGLPVEIRLQDYRDINEQFDRIASIGMFEHVGYKNYRTFMKVAHRCLVDRGLFLLHTIGSNHAYSSPDPWINKYIFPSGTLPAISQIGRSIEKLFVMEDWHNFGQYYDKTLMAWHHNFNKHWDEIKEDYSEEFQRMWNYYLLSCAAGFRTRHLELWQIVLSKGGVIGDIDFRKG